MADNKRIPQKKKTSDFVIYAVIAVILLVVGIWGGYVLQETANMKGEINFQKALDRSSDYANVSSFFAAVNSALTENGIAKKGAIYGGVAGLLVVAYQLSKTPKRFHRKGEEHGSARWGTDKEKKIVGDLNDFYNNAILAEDIFLVVDRKNVILTLFRTKTKRQLNTRKPKKPHNMSSVLPS